MSKLFADKLNKFIEKLSNLYFSDINGGKKRSLGIINNIPLQLSDTIIPIDVEVNDAQSYAIIAGVNWLNKVQGIIDLKRGQFRFTWDNKSYILPITCWEKPQNNNSEPIPLKNSSESNDLNNQTSSAETNSSEISEDEYESSDDEYKESKEFLDLEETNLSPINNLQLQQFLTENDHMFSKGMNNLGKTTIDQHQIITENVPPIYQRAYHISPAEHEFIQQELSLMLENKLISPSKSLWASPVVLVKKKNGKLRL
ncbi:12266_t:CDS:2, partial [Racocetra fulgida]